MNNYDPQLADVLQWIVDHHDTSKALRRDAQSALRLMTAAHNTHQVVLRDCDADVLAVRHDQHAALQRLNATPTRDNVRVVVELQSRVDVSTTHRLRSVVASETALANARETAGAVFRMHCADVLHLVAVERCKQPATCGDDSVPSVVRNAWRRLQFHWHHNLDEQLLMPAKFYVLPFTATAHDLPLTWLATEPDQLRASLQWCWQQIATGNVAWVPRPLTRGQRQRGRQPGDNGRCLKFTQQVDMLPDVAARPGTSLRR
jgi:hypothetical protein